MLYFYLLKRYLEVIYPFHRIPSLTKFLDFAILSKINTLGQ